MFKKALLLFFILCLVIPFKSAHSAYLSGFDAVNFTPAIDGTDYFTVYGSRTFKAWQGNLGLSFDFANRPLEFRGTGATTGRQSIVDNAFLMNIYGAMGFADWFTVGANLPLGYAWFFSADANAIEDNGGTIGDATFILKFRALDVDKTRVGLSFVPYFTVPTGDATRFMGNGAITGGINSILDFKFHERYEMSLNFGYTMRDDVSRTFTFAGGGTSTVRVDDLMTFGAGANFKVSKQFHMIVETFGSTVLNDFFNTTNSTSLEVGGGIRYYFGNSGISLDAGGGRGFIEGPGSPRFRAYMGLRWISPESQPCPECSAPDPRIKDNKIVLWGKIFFDTDKATIKPISFPVLDDVVDVLVKNPGIALVEVQGHTDARGSDAYNLKLSNRRSASAMQYLISRGINPSRLTSRGYGESQPIAPNTTVEGMSQNRRTEFVILQSNTGHYTGQAPTQY